MQNSSYQLMCYFVNRNETQEGQRAQSVAEWGGSSMSLLKQIQDPTMCTFVGDYFIRQPASSLPYTNSWDEIVSRFDNIISGRFAYVAQRQTRFLKATGAAGNGKPVWGLCPVYGRFCFKREGVSSGVLHVEQDPKKEKVLVWIL